MCLSILSIVFGLCQDHAQAGTDFDTCKCVYVALVDDSVPTTLKLAASALHCGVFILCRKPAWNQLLRSEAAICVAITNIENASETTMTTPTLLLTSSGSCL